MNQLLFCPPRQMIWNKGLGEGGDGEEDNMRGFGSKTMISNSELRAGES